MATKVEGKKVPGFIKKFNKFLGLPSKSDKILDILKISGIEEKINNNKGNIEKNMADIAEYHPDETSKLNKMCNYIWQNVCINRMSIKKVQSTKHYINMKSKVILLQLLHVFQPVQLPQQPAQQPQQPAQNLVTIFS